jgi:hypothetical protein
MPQTQAPDALLTTALLSALKDEQSAKEVLDSRQTLGLSAWEVPLSLCIGAAIGWMFFLGGQTVFTALAFATGFAGMSVATACARETRRIGRRLDALLLLQRAATRRAGLEGTLEQQSAHHQARE